MNKKGIFFLSLNSKKLEDFLIAETSKLINYDGILDVFVFDTFEVLDGIFFNSVNVDQQSNVIETTISKVKNKIMGINSLIRFSNISKHITPYILKVHYEYYNNKSFKRHCKNQIFQSLQPKFRKVGITTNKSSMIDLISPFLLAEIAYYLYIYHSGAYDIIFGMEKEMEIIQSIRNGKYENFNGFLSNDVPYIKINNS
jgi:hypothetical protein